MKKIILSILIILTFSCTTPSKNVATIESYADQNRAPAQVTGHVGQAKLIKSNSSQCNTLANLELKAAEALGEYRYKSQLNKETNSTIRTLHYAILDSADENFTHAVFDHACKTNIEAVNKAIEILTLDANSSLAQTAVLELLKLKN